MVALVSTKTFFENMCVLDPNSKWTGRTYFTISRSRERGSEGTAVNADKFMFNFRMAEKYFEISENFLFGQKWRPPLDLPLFCTLIQHHPSITVKHV